MKKNYTKISIILISLAIMSISYSCRYTKTVADDPNAVKLLCSGPEHQTNNGIIRANSSGFSSDMEIARDKALTNARARMSAQIGVFTSALTDFYKKDTRLDEDEKLETRFETLIREAFKNKLEGTYPICEEVRKESGKFRAYVAIELGGKELLNKVASQISNDEELKVDYDYTKFKTSYNDAMEELKKER